MKTQTAFVWAYSAVKLYAVAVVYMYIALVVQPGNTKADHAFGNNQTFQQRIGAIVVLFLADNRFDGFQHFGDSLHKFGLVLISLCDSFNGFRYVRHRGIPPSKAKKSVSLLIPYHEINHMVKRIYT